MCFICAYHIACHCLFSWDVYSSICAAGSAVITLNNEVEGWTITLQHSALLLKRVAP